jgi:UDP-N-acetylglucosamine/UDP-N-acetylgalactosamine diphosphorylase
MEKEKQRKQHDIRTRLLKKGVNIPCPQAVEISDDINPDRIAPNVTIHTGSKISGAETSIGPNSVIGNETPATVHNCQLGRDVTLSGGFFNGATFFDGSSVGSGAHIRPGTILEEQASGAHTVGLKQTILLPFVTVGSLINFCDILMAGGTSSKNHSEVGSSYIHFNFTPHQDKATASLVGDVPRGVLLDQAPIFLGGQGGLVGPCRIEYGTVIPAGLVCRKDVKEADKIHIPQTLRSGSIAYRQGVYKSVKRIIQRNLEYIGNLQALKAWYTHVRTIFVRDSFDGFTLDGGSANLDTALKERIKRLGDLASKFKYSIEELSKIHDTLPEFASQQQHFMDNWDNLKPKLQASSGILPPESLISELKSKPSGDYIAAVQSLQEPIKTEATKWLTAIVGHYLYQYSI